MSPSALDGTRALVLGLGRFSGGVETVRFLRAEGARVLVSDAAPRESLEESAREAESLGARLHFGVQTPALLADADLVVAGPALPFDHPVLVAAEQRGLPVTTETNLLLERVRAPVLGVTGTKGKSTTAALLAGILAEAGHVVHFGGNVGRALLGRVGSIRPGDLVVLELSSFQLWWTRRVRRSPHLTVVTNLFPDHLDRHHTFEAYAEAKRAALDHQGPGDVAVLPADDPVLESAGYLTAGGGRRVLYGGGGAFCLEGEAVRGPANRRVALGGYRLWGAHNRRNALAAAAAAFQVPGTEASHVERALRSAEPLPHRLSVVGELESVLFVDDSNATTPASTLCALEAVPRPVVLLVGGKDKGLDAAPLVEAIARRARGVVGIGTTGTAVVERVRHRLPTFVAGADLGEAVRRAFAMARPGDAVLLSPGFSSLDHFPSFRARGLRFQAAVEDLARERREGAGPSGVVGSSVP